MKKKVEIVLIIEISHCVFPSTKCDCMIFLRSCMALFATAFQILSADCFLVSTLQVSLSSIHFLSQHERNLQSEHSFKVVDSSSFLPLDL